ncbi:MAG: phage tail sheath subtilisin-like domain-containing protein [Pseudomonadota bacterium]|nr:phage tail sheath subtilisin-like domain-containing protein [Pseudomonadota bacterium]
MTVPFQNIPTTLRVPLFYAELDNSRANTVPVSQRALLIGQKTGAGTLTANVPVVVASQSDGRAAAGPGSILASMIDAYRANDVSGEMWALPLSDDGAATFATGSATFVGTTTASGAIPLYIAGRKLSIGIAAGQTAAQVAAIVAAAVTGASGYVVTATVDAVVLSKVVFTARNAGECGNEIDLRIAYAGVASGETMPAGLSVTFATMSGGTVNPVLTAALMALQDLSFDFIVCSLTDTVSLAAITALLNDANGRWSYTSQVYGHCWVGKRGTAGALAAFATAVNNQHTSCIGYADSPSSPWKWAAAFAGACAVSLRADPGIPLQYLTVAGILAPPLQSQFSLPIRNNTLLYGGVSTWTVDAVGNVVTENIVTTYVLNNQGQADDSYLEVERLFVLMYVLRQLRALVTSKYGRVKLAKNGTRLFPGSRVVTPGIVRADLIAKYREMEAGGFVQDSSGFAAGLVVEQNAQNRDRIDVLFPAVLINQLRVFAVLMQFRNS